MVKEISPQVPVSVTMTTTYVYDGEDIVLETVSDGTTTTQAQYVHGPGIDEPLARISGGQSVYYHADGLGSIVALTDSSQNVVQRYGYDSFGMVTASDPEFENSYTYTGREWDKELGLYFYRARYYDPMEGRFVSKDPIGFAGGDVNVYRYVQNNSLNWVDPDGKTTYRPFKTTADKIKKWKDEFDKYKGIYDECKGDMTCPGVCETCCKKISQSFPFTSSDASGWWLLRNECVALMCIGDK